MIPAYIGSLSQTSYPTVTLDPASRNTTTGWTLSNGNLTITSGNISTKTIRATLGRSGTGLYAFHVKTTSTSNTFTGISDVTETNAVAPGFGAGGLSICARSYPFAGNYLYKAGVAYALTGAGTRANFLVVVDLAQRKFYIRNDANQTSALTSLAANGTDLIYPKVGCSSNPQAITFNFGATPFEITLPSGVISWDGRQQG